MKFCGEIKMDKETREKITSELASDIVDNWDLGTTIEFAQQEMYDRLIDHTEKEFIEEWKDFYGEKFNEPT